MKERSVLWNLAALVIVIAGLSYASSLITLVLVAVFIAMVSAPAVLWLRARGLPSALAVLAVVLGVAGFFTAVGALVGTSINAFVRAAPVYKARLDGQVATLLDWLRQQGLETYGMDLLQSVEIGSVMSLIGNLLGALGGLLGNGLVILIIVVFILFEVPGMPAKFRAAFPDSEDSLGRLRLIAENVERYVMLKTFVSLLTGVVLGFWVAVLGVDFALLWGLLAFLLNYIPTFGSIVAGVPAVLMALVQFGPGVALLVLIGFLVVNFLVGNVLEPKLMGQGMGLSTLVVFVSLLAWGSVLGLGGMFLAVPLTMALKIVLDSSPETRWLAVLMGPEPKEPKQAGQALPVPGAPESQDTDAQPRARSM